MPIFSSIKSDPKFLDQNQCSTCLSDFEDKDDVIARACNHIFHPTCDQEWKESELGKKLGCSICRSGSEEELANTRNYSYGIYFGLTYATFLNMIILGCLNDSLDSIDYKKQSTIGFHAFAGVLGFSLGVSIGKVFSKYVSQRCEEASLLKGLITSGTGLASSIILQGIAFSVLGSSLRA